jgi:hypothetical protein
MNDEIWITKDGRKIKVADMTEKHAKNVLRMILRQRREKQLEEENNIDECGGFEFWKR